MNDSVVELIVAMRGVEQQFRNHGRCKISVFFWLLLNTMRF